MNRFSRNEAGEIPPGKRQQRLLLKISKGKEELAATGRPPDEPLRRKEADWAIFHQKAKKPSLWDKIGENSGRNWKI